MVQKINIMQTSWNTIKHKLPVPEVYSCDLRAFNYSNFQLQITANGNKFLCYDDSCLLAV